MFILFLKLPNYSDSQDNLFKLISKFPIFTVRLSPSLSLYNIFTRLSQNKITLLNSLLENNDREIFLKGSIIWKAVLDLKFIDFTKRLFSKLLKDIVFTPDIGKRLLQEQEEDSQFHTIGITFLTYSDYPIENTQEQKQLLDWLKNVDSETEEKEWGKFIKNSVISDEKQSHWSTFLEKILSDPKPFGHLILNAAMERYQSSNNAMGITISEEEEKTLDLV
ncbi:MAG: hypothetical protein QNJ64_00035 [Crocosphaera sp.]|nr:hypothetical protein [Crocosphaera sp.]